MQEFSVGGVATSLRSGADVGQWGADRVYDARQHGLTGDGVANDQPALAELVDALGAACAKDRRPRVIYCPPGVYSIRDSSTVWRSGLSLLGAGPGVTRFELANPVNRDQPTALATFTHEHQGASRDNHLADCTFAGFEIDGRGVELPRYTVRAKGLDLQYVLRGRFRELYIHDTVATGFGCDFLQDSFVDRVVVVHSGRMDTGTEPGGAGIGIGIGGWGGIERLTVANCITVGNGRNGIFVELQDDSWPPPRGIRIVACHAEGNRNGIGDWGADGLLVTGCTMIDNVVHGFDVSGDGVAGVAGVGGQVTGCVIDGNAGDGVHIAATPGPYSVTGNRISRNGGYGCRGESAGPITVRDNDIWANADRLAPDAA
jgi:hypothetical protein